MLCSVAIYIALVRLALFNSFNPFISFTPLFAKFDIPAARPETEKKTKFIKGESF